MNVYEDNFFIFDRKIVDDDVFFENEMSFNVINLICFVVFNICFILCKW